MHELVHTFGFITGMSDREHDRTGPRSTGTGTRRCVPIGSDYVGTPPTRRTRTGGNGGLLRGP